MDILEFIERLALLKPNRKLLSERGYSEEMIEKLFRQEYLLKDKFSSTSGDISKLSSVKDFISNFDLNEFRIRNISFSDIDRDVKGYYLVGGFDGGYLGLNEINNVVYIIYADEINNIHEIFSTSTNEFFEILLQIAEYSSKISEGVFSPFDVDVKEEYIDRCFDICPKGTYEIFF